MNRNVKTIVWAGLLTLVIWEVIGKQIAGKIGAATSKATQ